MPDKIVKIEGLDFVIPKDTAKRWDDSPVSLILDDGSLPPRPNPRDLRRHYLDQDGQYRVAVSKTVFDKGKLPYPEVRHIKRLEKGRLIPVFDPKLPWMHYGAMARYATAEDLIQQGIINLDPWSSAVSRTFDVNHQAIQKLRSGQPVLTDDSEIHPIYRYNDSRWYNTTQLTYEYLKPSLRIASKILGMEVVLDYLSALAKPWVEEQPTPVHKELSGGLKQYSFFPKVLTSADRDFTARELVRMQQYIDFDWFESELVLMARTGCQAVKDPRDGRWVPRRGMNSHDGSRAANVSINSEMKRYIDLDNPPNNSFVPNSDSKSRILRTQFRLALVIVHETVHAWVLNTRRLPPDPEAQPYCNDHRIAEVGWAMESIIFGSIVNVIANNPELYDSPLGLSTSRFPGARNGGSRLSFNIEPFKASAAKWGVNHDTEYGLSMKFIHQFFTDEFWDTRVERFGPGMLRAPKTFGVRVFHSSEVDPLESPGCKRKLIDGQEWYDPEPHSPGDDTLHPNITEGVLYLDKVFDGMGRELDTGGSARGEVPKRKRRRTMPRAPELDILSPIAEVRSPISPEDVEMPDVPSFGRGDGEYRTPASPALSVGQAYGGPSQAHSSRVLPTIPTSENPGFKPDLNKTLPSLPYDPFDTRPVTKRDLLKADFENVKKDLGERADRKIAKAKAKTKDVGAKAKGLLSPIKFKGLFKPKEKGGYEEIEPYEWS